MNRAEEKDEREEAIYFEGAQAMRIERSNIIKKEDWTTVRKSMYYSSKTVEEIDKYIYHCRYFRMSNRLKRDFEPYYFASGNAQGGGISPLNFYKKEIKYNNKKARQDGLFTLFSWALFK
jgi:hypothetical protein